MENLLQGIPNVIVRMDDILISGKDDDHHMANLEAVLKKLSEAGLRLRKEKCFFMVPEVTYCGYVIDGSGIKPVEAKVDAIQNAPVPENVTQLRAFLGMLNYYHRFLPDIATVLEPLHKLLRQGTKWCWKTEQQMAFDKSKKLLQSANLLVHFQPDLELILASDASDYGVGAVLSHRMADGAERPIGYVSRSLNKAERGYSTIEKEALAIIFGVKKFNQFLYSQKFTIQTDHKPLEGLFNEKKGRARGYVWWPNMDRELEDAVKKCQQCQLHQKAPAEAPLHPWEWPGQPWSRVHIDYAGPYKGHMYLVVIDAHSKWISRDHSQ